MTKNNIEELRKLLIESEETLELNEESLEALSNDLNTPLTLSILHKQAKNKDKVNLLHSLDLLGLDISKEEEKDDQE